MTKQHSSVPLPPDALSALLMSARRARQRGDVAGARSLLRAILAHQPNEPRAWLLLATVAETRAEQQHAFEQVLELDPSNSVARRGLDAMRAADQRVTRPIPAADTLIVPPPQPTVEEPETEDWQEAFDEEASREQAERVRRIRWPLYVLLAIAGTVLLATALLIRFFQPQAQAAIPTLAPLASVAPLATAALPAESLSTSAPAPTFIPTTVAPVAATVAVPSPVVAESPEVAAPTVETLPTVVPTPSVRIGQVQSQGEWNIALARPQDAVLLSGSIGPVQPNGRFVLTLLAVGNDAPAERVLPQDLVTLVDANGARYQPLPTASTAYLQAYGEGQAGVLSMESPIPGGGGLVSVPVIFDVPADARGLSLVVGSASDGWRIGG